MCTYHRGFHVHLNYHSTIASWRSTDRVEGDNCYLCLRATKIPPTAILACNDNNQKFYPGGWVSTNIRCLLLLRLLKVTSTVDWLKIKQQFRRVIAHGEMPVNGSREKMCTHLQKMHHKYKRWLNNNVSLKKGPLSMVRCFRESRLVKDEWKPWISQFVRLFFRSEECYSGIEQRFPYATIKYCCCFSNEILCKNKNLSAFSFSASSNLTAWSECTTNVRKNSDQLNYSKGINQR